MAVAHDPVLLHVGYVKTGTTFLQQVVFSGVIGDIELAAGPETRRHTVHNILLADDYSFDPTVIRARMEAYASRVRQRGKLPVWSEEMLLGNPPSSRYDGFANARKAHAIYPDARVLITIRRQQSIALSMYLEYVLGGGAAPLTTFIGTGNEPVSYSPILRPGFLCYDRAIRHYRSLFGASRVLVLPLEMLAADPAHYIGALSEFTGSALATTVERRRIHAGETFPAVALRRRLNRFVVKDPTRKGRRGFDALANRTVRLFNRFIPERLNAELGRSYRAAIESRYSGMFADSNRETARMTGLDLAAYGYDT